jgi:insulysin
MTTKEDWIKASENHWEFSHPLEKSDNDDRDYRLIKLCSNDLQVLLVHDKDTDKSSAALDVHVGHISDPVSFLSMAHLFFFFFFFFKTKI